MKRLWLLVVLLIPFTAVADNPIAFRAGPGPQFTCSASVPTHVATRGTVWCNSSDANKLYYTDPSGTSAAVGSGGGGGGTQGGTTSTGKVPYASGANTLSDGELSFTSGTHTYACNASTNFDYSASSGSFKTPTGTTTIGGPMSLAATVFASLGTPANGTVTYCSDCTIATTCAGGGTGAIAQRLNGAWSCGTSAGGGTQNGSTTSAHIPYASGANTLADTPLIYDSASHDIYPSVDNTNNLGDGEFSAPLHRWKIGQFTTVAVTDCTGTAGCSANYSNGVLFYNGSDLTLWPERIGTGISANLVTKGSAGPAGGNWTGLGGAGSSTTGGNWTGGGGNGQTNGGDANLTAGAGTTGNGGALTCSGGSGTTFGGHATLAGGAGAAANNANDGFARITGNPVLIGDINTPQVKIGQTGAPGADEVQINFDKAKINGHLLFTGTGTPTVTLGTGAGTGATFTITGNDTAGHVDVTTAGTPAATAAIFTATFATAYGAAPRAVIITPASSTAAWLTGTSTPWMDTSLVSASAFTFDSGSTALASGVTYRWWYHVLGSTN